MQKQLLLEERLAEWSGIGRVAVGLQEHEEEHACLVCGWLGKRACVGSAALARGVFFPGSQRTKKL